MDSKKFYGLKKFDIQLATFYLRKPLIHGD